MFDLGMLKNEYSSDIIIKSIKDSNFCQNVRDSFLDVAKEISFSKSIDQFNLEQKSEHEPEIMQTDDLSSNCIHINICYFIWSKNENSEKDPVELAQEYRRSLLKNPTL